MPRISIIGIGNTLRADDGVGVRVAEELSSRDLGAGVDVVSGELAGMLLAPYFINSDHVIVVDAVDAQDTPGSVFMFRAEDGLPKLRSNTSHGMGVGELVRVARLSGSKAEIIDLCHPGGGRPPHGRGSIARGRGRDPGRDRHDRGPGRGAPGVCDGAVRHRPELSAAPADHNTAAHMS